MPKWLRKSFVIIITILTFGLVTPSQASVFDDSNAVKSPKKDIVEDEKSSIDSTEISGISNVLEETSYTDKEDFIKKVVKEAETLSYLKFGQKIKPVIENEFSTIIFPNIEKAIENVANQYPEEELIYLSVSEVPGSGLSEKIFHITNEKTTEDVIRFHVRRDHPPQQGYWFNFHYHTYHDNFQTHHHLGSIYWDKNTPPRWMA